MCNIENICRLCGTSEGIKVKIFEPGRSFVSTIHQLLPIMVDERDPWSKLICHRCAFKLEEFYNFRELCVKTDTYMKTLLSWKQPVTLQPIPAQPQNEQLKREHIEQNGRPGPSLTPPSLSVQVKEENNNGFSSEPPTLTPATAPASCKQVQANSLQHTFAVTQAPPPASDLHANVVFVNFDLGNSYLAEEPEFAHSNVTTDSCDTGFLDSGVSEEMGVDARPDTSKAESRKCKETSASVQVSKKRKTSSKHCSRFHRAIKVNSVKSVLANVRSEDCNENRKQSNTPETKHCVRTEATNVNDTVLNLTSHAMAGTQQNKVLRKPGPKSKVGCRDDDSESDESDVLFVLQKPAHSVLDVIDMTEAISSSEEEVNESDPEEGLAPHTLLTKIPGICNIYTCSLCEGTFTSKKCVNSHVCKIEELHSLSPEEQVPGGKTCEDKTSEKETCKNVVPQALASENRLSQQGACDKIVLDEHGSSRGSTSESTLSSSSESSSELPKTNNLRQDATIVGKDHSNQDVFSAGCGLYECDICGYTFNRLVTLMAHKNRHLYGMNDDDDDDDDDCSYVTKKKKPIAKEVTGDC